MGAVRVKTVNDRLLQIDYSDPEEIKQVIMNWGMIESLAQKGDTVACAVLVDLERALGASISDFERSKKSGFESGKNTGVLTEAQYISIMYVLGLGYRQDEVAFVLNCEKQTINKHIRRGVERICKYLVGEAEYEESEKERGRSGGQVAQGERFVLHKRKPGEKVRVRSSVLHSRSGGKAVKKRDTDK